MTGWRDSAACAGTWNRLPWVNPDAATPAVLTRMLDMCNTCPVLDACQADLEERNDFTGVRAGVVWSANPRFLGHTRKVVRCAGCGLVMLADGRGQRFCSLRCRRTAERKRCRVCGAPVPRWASVYCSDECRPAEDVRRRRNYHKAAASVTRSTLVHDRGFPSGNPQGASASVTAPEKVSSRAPLRTVPALADNPDQRTLPT